MCLLCRAHYHALKPRPFNKLPYNEGDHYYCNMFIKIEIHTIRHTFLYLGHFYRHAVGSTIRALNNYSLYKFQIDKKKPTHRNSL